MPKTISANLRPRRALS